MTLHLLVLVLVYGKLSQDGTRQPVHFVSRSLATAEAHYSQIEREALAIVFAVKRLHSYLYGRRFTLRTDHRPLLRIFGNNADLPATAVSRLQRWRVVLSAYDYDLEHICGCDNVAADCLSRLPQPLTTAQVNAITRAVRDNEFPVHDVLPVSAADIALASKSDSVISAVMEYLKYGWPTEISETLKPLYQRRDQLTIEAGCLIWNHRTVIPVVFRRDLLQELHSVHLGTSRMKAVARSYFWWPGLDQDIEVIVSACQLCQETASRPASDITHQWIYPNKPFERVHADFAEFNGRHYLIVVDAFSKWPEVYQMQKDTSATATVYSLLSYIASFGIPQVLVTDNGPQFTSKVFQTFCQENGIVHKCSPPYHPATNGQAERFVQELKKALRTKPSNVSEQAQVQRFLFSYRNTPHSTTHASPASLLFRNSPTTRLSLLKPNFASQHRARRDQEECISKKNFLVSESVSVLNTRNGTGPKWIPGVIMQHLGPASYIVQCGEQSKHVHSDHLRARPSNVDPTQQPRTTQPSSTVQHQQTPAVEHVPRQTIVTTQASGEPHASTEHQLSEHRLSDHSIIRNVHVNLIHVHCECGYKT